MKGGSDEQFKEKPSPKRQPPGLYLSHWRSGRLFIPQAFGMSLNMTGPVGAMKVF